ncbi:YafY family protein [uncultured Pelagimonas sp.]|uniref:helix-turn-helix transcriptional regulator n=1 Tax=uncultured Pelagimonas sp. TaxID=1618102 RepID=UPI002627E841|nr:YafY family protein [uncultured Pelagimonas sp.]
MRRTDRLFELIQIIRDGRLHKATDLAEALEVSVRTIYRDIETLVGSGIPIEGERGVGYILRAPIFLPPVSLTEVELEALHLGAALVQRSADPELQQAARRLVDKVDQVMPDARKPPSDGWGLAIFGMDSLQASFAHMPIVRAAIREKQVLEIDYARADGQGSRRFIRPLQMEYWGQVWTCTAWCETRDDFRVFRIDRMRGVLEAGRSFVDEPGKRLRDYVLREGFEQAQEKGEV